MRILPAIFANACLAVSILGFGNLLKPLFPGNSSRVDRIVLTLIGGLGILGTLLFCIGQVWFSRTAIVLVLGVGILLSSKLIVRVIRERRQLVAGLQPPGLPLLIIAAVLLITVVGGLAMPTGDMNDDSIAYHYLGPTVWLRHEVIRAVPDELLTYFPVLMETQYAALMSIGGKRAPQLFSVTSFVVILLAGAALAIRMGLDQKGVWWVLALLAAMPVVYRGVYGGMVDAVFAAFVLLAARVAFDAEQLKDFVGLGIFCGFAIGLKFSGIVAFCILLFCTFLAVFWSKRCAPLRMLKYLGFTTVLAAAVASPFYLRNWILYGGPFYPPPPALLRIFPGTQIRPQALNELVTAVVDTGLGMGRSFLDFLLLPFNLTYHTANFRGAGGVGLVPFALAPFAFIRKPRDSFFIALTLFTFLEAVAWFLTPQVSRYLIPVYVLAAIFGVLGWQYVVRVSPRYGRALAGVAVAISILYGTWMTASERKEDVRAGLSAKFEEQRRLRETPYFESFEYINHQPSVQRILVLYPHVAAYFIEKDYVKPFGRWGEQTIPGAETASQVMEQLPSLHVTHVLDVRTRSGKFDLPENPPGLRKVFERENERVYEVE